MGWVEKRAAGSEGRGEGGGARWSVEGGRREGDHQSLHPLPPASSSSFSSFSFSLPFLLCLSLSSTSPSLQYVCTGRVSLALSPSPCLSVALYFPLTPRTHPPAFLPSALFLHRAPFDSLARQPGGRPYALSPFSMLPFLLPFIVLLPATLTPSHRRVSPSPPSFSVSCPLSVVSLCPSSLDVSLFHPFSRTPRFLLRCTRPPTG